MGNHIGVDTQKALKNLVEYTWKGKPKKSKSPVDEKRNKQEWSRVPQDTRNPVGRRGDHPQSLNTTNQPIENSTVRERWKEPREGSEKEPETICLQTDGASNRDIVLFVERANELCCKARIIN